MTIPPFLLDDIRKGVELMETRPSVSSTRIAAALLLIETATSELRFAMNKPKKPARVPSDTRSKLQNR